MTDDDLFSAFRDDDEEPETAQPPAFADEDDEFERLRMSSARAGSMYDDDMEMTAGSGASAGGSSFALSNFSPGQRLVLAVLLFLNVVAVLFGLLVVMGRIG